jgi:hypothetical protein
MPKESSERIILLNAYASPSEKRNQLVLSKQKVFYHPKVDNEMGLKIWEDKRIRDQVIHITTGLMVLNLRELLQKESF